MEALLPATPADEPAVSALLASCGLPHVDVAPHLRHFTIARDGSRVVGVIGLEVHGADGLLRSLAVAPDRRGQGVARRLYATLIRDARRLGITRLFLLTTSAQGFFEMLGFRAVKREAVPDAIRATGEFRQLCPETAECMMRSMPRD